MKTIAGCLALSAGVASADTTAESPWHLAVKLDWTLLLGPGFGGSVSVHHGHHEATVMAFGAKLPPTFRDMLLSDAGDSTPVNLGVELGYSYYLRPDRKWLFLGALISADQYRSDDRDTLNALYLVPRAGVRIPIYKGLFVEPSVGLAIRAAASDPADGMGVRRLAPVLLIPVGMSFGL